MAQNDPPKHAPRALDRTAIKPARVIGRLVWLYTVAMILLVGLASMGDTPLFYAAGMIGVMGVLIAGAWQIGRLSSTDPGAMLEGSDLDLYQRLLARRGVNLSPPPTLDHRASGPDMLEVPFAESDADEKQHTAEDTDRAQTRRPDALTDDGDNR